MRLLPPADTLPPAKAAARRALELDDLLAEAHTSLAWARMQYDWEWGEAEEGFTRALERNPSYAVAHMWHGVFLMAVGRLDEAVVEVELAQELDPLSPIINAVAGWPFYFMRRYERAIEQYRRALQVEPNSLPGHVLLGYAYAQMGEGAKAVAESEKARALEDSPFILAGLAHGYAVAGRDLDSRAVLAELNRVSRDGRYVSPYDLAGIHLRLGGHEEALRLLQEAVEDRSAWLIFLGVEPAFDSLRVRFTALVQRLGLSQ
jgi:tetratricopeptide (TPR) repeat protein